MACGVWIMSSSPVMCVSVQCVKNCCFAINLTPEGIFIKRVRNLLFFTPDFDPHFENDNVKEK